MPLLAVTGEADDGSMAPKASFTGPTLLKVQLFAEIMVADTAIAWTPASAAPVTESAFAARSAMQSRRVDSFMVRLDVHRASPGRPRDPGGPREGDVKRGSDYG